MRILQINTVCGAGSTGRTMTELGKELEKLGHESFYAYGQGATNAKNSFKIGTKIENNLHNLQSRVWGKQGYYTYNGTKKLINYIKEIDPTIIHLRNLHGNYINLELLFEYLKTSGKPVVWTLHDCWAFTGKCSHFDAVNCQKWQTHCYDCPLYKAYPPSLFFDRTKKLFADKKKWFTSIENLTIMPVSKWLANEAEKSFFKNYPIKPVYNWIDMNVFSSQKSEPTSIATEFNVLCVSGGWRKDHTRTKILLQLAKRLEEQNIKLTVIGSLDKGLELPTSIHHIPYVENTTKLAEYYAKADAYIHLSYEDTFGKVIAEAMSCGTPAIVFNATACPELIGENCGYVVEKGDIDGIIKTIKLIKKNGKESYSQSCINYVKDNFNLKTNTNAIIRIYESLC